MNVTFPVSVAFMIPVAFGGRIILLPEYEITIYVSFTGFTFDSTSSPSSYEKRRPKRAFEALLVVVVVLLTASCSSSPTDVVAVVVLLPVVEADAGLIIMVDAKITANVKIVAAVARYVLCSRCILLILLSDKIIFRTLRGKTQNKIVSSFDGAEPPVEFEHYGFLFFIAILRLKSTGVAEVVGSNNPTTWSISSYEETTALF